MNFGSNLKELVDTKEVEKLLEDLHGSLNKLRDMPCSTHRDRKMVAFSKIRKYCQECLDEQIAATPDFAAANIRRLASNGGRLDPRRLGAHLAQLSRTSFPIPGGGGSKEGDSVRSSTPANASNRRSTKKTAKGGARAGASKLHTKRASVAKKAPGKRKKAKKYRKGTK